MSFVPDIATEPQWQRTRLRVPREDGAVLARPALDEVADLARRNAATLARCECRLLDQPIKEFRQAARSELLLAAADFRSRPSSSDASLLIATGHQPELVHPGVWIKQLAVSALAQQHNAIGLNLVVDNDTLNATTIRVPTGSRESLSTQAIAFDDPRAALPWEEAQVLNRDCFESFGQRVSDMLRQWGIEPLMASVWPDVVRHSRDDSNLAACFTAARASVERRWGFGNLELRMSRLCESTSFCLFALHLLRNAEHLRSIYNATVAEYRSINRIRNTSHPVPDLQRVDGWCEVPLWIWQAGATARRRVFVREQSGRILLADAPSDSRLIAELGIAATDISDDLAVLSSLQQRGWRLRSRALTTTCFARLCLCDVFVHGIGGAKYDEITDRLLTRFFGVTAPSFVTLSATAYLPFATPFAATENDVRRLKQDLRDTQQNAQRHIDGTPSEAHAILITEKQSLVAQQQMVDGLIAPCGKEKRRLYAGDRRYRRLREINRQLRSSTQALQEKLHEQITTAESEVAANKIINSREYASWLYPESRLQQLLQPLRDRLEVR